MSMPMPTSAMSMSMPMPSTTSMPSSSSSQAMMMMTPFLHFARGDYVLFKTWAPATPGAISGACVGLFLIAILERMLAAVRGILEVRWMRMALAKTNPYLPQEVRSEDVLKRSSSDPVSPGSDSSLRGPRTFAPFIATVDIPRGLIHALQATLGYALMLVVMSFDAAYIIAIILGLGIGELLFGRFANLRNHALH